MGLRRSRGRDLGRGLVGGVGGVRGFRGAETGCGCSGVGFQGE